MQKRINGTCPVCGYEGGAWLKQNDHTKYWGVMCANWNGCAWGIWPTYCDPQGALKRWDIVQNALKPARHEKGGE